MKTDWIQVDTQDLNPEVTKTIRGAKVKVSHSPYDVPQMIRGFKDPESNDFVIEFKYLTDEPVSVKRTPSSAVSLRVGQNSGRIYTIKVDIAKLRDDPVRLELKETVKGALQALNKQKVSDRVSDRLHERYQVAQDVLSSNIGRLIPDCAAGRGLVIDPESRLK